jgi:tetratricopeptide (TPR) repeat protein
MTQETTAGEWLRRLREGAGRSQDDQAAVLSELAGREVTRNEVSRWERNGRMLTPYWQQHQAHSFGIPVEDLARLVATTKAQLRAQEHDPQETSNVLRRQFLTTSMGMSVTLSPRTGALAQTGRIGNEAVEELRARAVRMRKLDDHLGGGDTYRLYAAELAETVRLINECSYTGLVGQKLLSIVAQQSQQTGWAAFDIGDHATARRLYESSREAARLAGDSALEGNALSLLSYQMIDMQQSGVDAAIQSCEEAGQASSPTVRALMWERQAFAYAHAGDRLKTEQSLAAAQEALAERGREPDPDWACWADELEFQLISGRCWAELRQPTYAAPLLESVLENLPEIQARNIAVYSTWLAGTYLDAGQVEQAATVLGRALDLAADVASVRPARRVAFVARRMDAYRANPTVAGLLDRVAATTSRPPSP